MCQTLPGLGSLLQMPLFHVTQFPNFHKTVVALIIQLTPCYWLAKFHEQMMYNLRDTVKIALCQVC